MFALAPAAQAEPGDIGLVAGQYYGACLESRSPEVEPSGSPTAARFGYNTAGIAVTPGGDRLFIADGSAGRPEDKAGRIEMVTLRPTRAVTTLVPDVVPTALAVGPSNASDPTRLYFVTKEGGDLVLKWVNADTGDVTEMAAMDASTSNATATGLAIDGQGNAYVAIQGADSSGLHFVAAGSQTFRPIASSSITQPYALAFDVNEGSLFVTELGDFDDNGLVGTGRLVRIDSPQVTGQAAVVRTNLLYPSGVAIDPTGRLFVAEGSKRTVTELDPSNLQDLQPVAGIAKTAGASGDGGAGTQAKLQSTLRLAADVLNNVFILDADNCVVRMVERMPEKVKATDTTVAGNTNTTVGTDTTLPRATDPTIPSGQVRDVPETQISPETQVQPRAETDPGLAADVDPGPAANFDGGRGDALLGSEFTNPGSATQFDGGFDGVFDATFGGNFAGSTGGVAVDPGAAVGGAIVEPVAPLPPPAPAPAPGFLPPAPAPGASPPVPGAMGAESSSPRGLPRYAMVAHDRAADEGLRPVAAAAACGIIGLFGSCLIAAMGAGGGAREARRAVARVRPRRAH